MSASEGPMRWGSPLLRFCEAQRVSTRLESRLFKRETTLEVRDIPQR